MEPVGLNKTVILALTLAFNLTLIYDQVSRMEHVC